LHLVYARVENLGFLACFTLRDVFAIFPLLFLERHSKELKKRLRFLVRLSRCGEDNIHTFDFVYLIKVDFREDKLLFDTH